MASRAEVGPVAPLLASGGSEKGSASIRWGAVLRLCGEHLTASALGAASWGALLRAADRLPALSGGMLECHLSGASSRMDLALRAGRFDGGREALAGRHPWLAFDEALLAHPRWAPVRAFGQAWAEPDEGPLTRVENVWLEFDHAAGAELDPVPSVFFDVDRRGVLAASEAMRVVERGLASLAPATPRRTRDALTRCLDALPPRAHVDHVGVMLPRTTDAIRLCLGGFAPDQVEGYLRAFQGAREAQRVQRIVDAFSASSSHMVLDLDVGACVAPGAGIELFYQGREAWSDALAGLVAAGLCAPGARDALLAWPGPAALGEGTLREALSNATGTEVRQVIRRLNHVKLRLDPNGDLTAKAYLYLCYA